MTEESPDTEGHGLTPTRRSAIKIAVGATTATTMGTTPVTGQATDREKWRFKTDDIIRSSPTIVDGTVFFGSWDSNIYALDAESGDEQWTFSTDPFLNSTSPTVIGGTLFFGSWDSHIYAIDAETGDKQWMFETGGPVRSSPTVVDDTVFVGSNDAKLYALDADSGDKQWTFEISEAVISSPTVVDSIVFVGGYDGNVYALDARTGNKQWVFETDDYVVSSPTIADGTVFIGSVDNNLYAVNSETGEQQWVFETVTDIRSSPTVSDKTVLIGGGGNNLYAINSDTGEQQWAFDTGDSIYRSSPTVADGTVFVGSGGGGVSEGANLYAVDLTSGDQQWAFEGAGQIQSSPIVVDGTVFVGSDDGNLYAVNADIDDSSEGSRVNLGTLGHHHVWADRSSSDSDDKSSDEGQIELPFTEKFESGLNGWNINQRFRTGDERKPADPTRGDGSYSEEYGGSVRLHVDGGPSTIGVARETTGIEAGTTITATTQVEARGTQPGNIDITIFAPDGDDNEDARSSNDGDVSSGETVVSLTVEESYPAGSEIRVLCDVWPGEFTAYVTEISATPTEPPEPPEPPETSPYTDSGGYVDSEGLLDAGADYRNGEISEDRLSEVASAFRSGEPLS